MRRFCPALFALLIVTLAGGARVVSDIKGPDMGYIYPAGAAAGSTVEVLIGGYDWTPDMELFVHQSGVKMEFTGLPSPVIVPEPPYWFGAKSYANALPLPREFPAKVTIPRDCPPGPIFWQAANANGVTTTGVFMVGDPAETEIVEVERRKSPQVLPSLPVTVSGRLVKIEDIDRYRFTAPRSGPVTLSLCARRLGSGFNGVIEVYDAAGKLVAEACDTEGLDAELTFVAQASAEYSAHVRDIDFRGDRSYGYRLSIAAAPRVVTAVPAIARRGETRKVEFVGYGIATGQNKLETVTCDVKFDAVAPATRFSYRLDTPYGKAAAISLLLSDGEESLLPAPQPGQAKALTLPAAVTSVFAQRGVEHLYTLEGTKGDVWSFTLQAREVGSPLDPAISIRGADGKELARGDDLPGTVDCTLEYTVPLDGTYTLAVSDLSGKAGLPSSSYRLVARESEPDFALQATVQRLGVMIGEKAELSINVVRSGGFDGPIQLSFKGLPAGMTPEGDLLIPGDPKPAPPAPGVKPKPVAKKPAKPGVKNLFKVSLQVAADAAAAAGPVEIRGTAKIDDQEVVHVATAPATGSLAPSSPADSNIGVVMLAAILPPVCKVEPLEKDGGRSVHRGTTFPAPIVIERYGDFTGEIVMQMASAQSRHRQGIWGPETVVPPGVTRLPYPCYMPEWLETDRTSRMAVIGVTKVPDPKGNLRYAVAGVQGQITITIEGALLKLVHSTREMTSPVGQPLSIPVKLSRSVTLKDPARLELALDDDLRELFIAEPLNLPVGQTEAVFKIQPTSGNRLVGRHTLGIRATVMQNGQWPCISQTNVPIEFVDSATTAK